MSGESTWPASLSKARASSGMSRRTRWRIASCQPGRGPGSDHARRGWPDVIGVILPAWQLSCHDMATQLP